MGSIGARRKTFVVAHLDWADGDGGRGRGKHGKRRKVNCWTKAGQWLWVSDRYGRGAQAKRLLRGRDCPLEGVCPHWGRLMPQSIVLGLKGGYSLSK